jgi:hypothetical protein
MDGCRGCSFTQFELIARHIISLRFLLLFAAKQRANWRQRLRVFLKPIDLPARPAASRASPAATVDGSNCSQFELIETVSNLAKSLRRRKYPGYVDAFHYYTPESFLFLRHCNYTFKLHLHCEFSFVFPPLF